MEHEYIGGGLSIDLSTKSKQAIKAMVEKVLERNNLTPQKPVCKRKPHHLDPYNKRK